MAVRKRANLRAKATARSNTTRDTSSKQYELPEDPKAFLHEHKDTKRDKMDTKRKEFLTKLTDKSGDFSGISKSSVRRRKRKQKDELLPKMQDLLSSLDETTKSSQTQGNVEASGAKKVAKKVDLLQSVNIVDSKSAFITNNKKIKNIPNPKNKTGIKLIESEERSRFGSILKDSGFKKSPFASLRENIQNRLKTEGL